MICILVLYLCLVAYYFTGGDIMTIGRAEDMFMYNTLSLLIAIAILTGVYALLIKPLTTSNQRRLRPTDSRL